MSVLTITFLIGWLTGAVTIIAAEVAIEKLSRWWDNIDKNKK